MKAAVDRSNACDVFSSTIYESRNELLDVSGVTECYDNVDQRSGIAKSFGSPRFMQYLREP